MDSDIKDKIKKMKKVVLHIHLDGSLRPKTVYNWLKNEGNNNKLTLEQVEKDLMVDKNCRDLNEYLTKFDLPCKMLQNKEYIEQAMYELFEDLYNQNVVYAEVRFAPCKHREKGLEYNEIVEAAISGMNRAKKKFLIDGSLILCAMRGAELSDNLETVKVAKKYLGHVVSAIDLAGAEALFSTENYKEVFELAKKLNIPFTIHAGEADGAKSIKKALEFGASRIGHGVRCLEDKELVSQLVKEKIVLEVCPISNLQTGAIGEKHPIEELYKKGLKVTINPDNNTVSNTDIIQEYEWVLENTNLTLQDLNEMNLNAIRSIFN